MVLFRAALVSGGGLSLMLTLWLLDRLPMQQREDTNVAVSSVKLPEIQELPHAPSIRNLTWASVDCDTRAVGPPNRRRREWIKVNEDLELTLSQYFGMHRNQTSYNFLFDCTSHAHTLQNEGYTRETFKNLKPNARILHIPNMRYFHIEKKELCKISVQAYKRFGINIVPPCVPTPTEETVNTRAISPGHSQWLWKDSSSHAGKRQRYFEAGEIAPLRANGVLEALVNPLTSRGRKIDIRLFALVASLDPPRLYLSQYGFTRIGTTDKKEPLNAGGLGKTYKVQEYATERGPSSVGSLGNYMAVIQANGHDPQKVWNKIKEKLALEFLLSGQQFFGCKTNDIPYPCGATSEKGMVDVIVDESGEPYIMENGLSGFHKPYPGALPFDLNAKKDAHRYESFDPIAALEQRRAESGILLMFMAPVRQIPPQLEFDRWLKNQTDVVDKLRSVQKYTFRECISLLQGMAAEAYQCCESGMANVLPRQWRSFDARLKFDDDDRLLYEIHEAFESFSLGSREDCVKVKF